MVAIAIIALILVVLWFISGSRRTHKYYFNKYMLIVTIAAVGILMFNARTPASEPKQAKAAYNTNIPPISAAPYVAPTSSRFYYVKSYQSGTDGNPVLTEYYIYDKNSWKYSKIELPLYKKVFGEVKLIKR